jgi:hypothetical protein
MAVFMLGRQTSLAAGVVALMVVLAGAWLVKRRPTTTAGFEPRRGNRAPE